ncbi:hypothetical protein [Cetobacterium sp.]|uniref:hypothetical protein n=1 Tax=Cetobacterium sp. TaxID=2071632 RepID=UPI003F30C5AF
MNNITEFLLIMLGLVVLIVSIILIIFFSIGIVILFQSRKKAIINKLIKIKPNLTKDYLEKFDRDILEKVLNECEKEVIKEIKEKN